MRWRASSRLSSATERRFMAALYLFASPGKARRLLAPKQGRSHCPPEPAIGSGAGDCAPAPSHTTGRAVFRIRRLNAAARYTVAARSDGIQNSWRRNTALLNAVCKLGLAAIFHAPWLLCATFSKRPLSPKARSFLSRPRQLSQRCQKQLRMGRRIQPSSP